MNDTEIHSLVKEEVDFDPTKTEELNVYLCINDKKDNDNEPAWVFDGSTMPWILEEFESKIESALNMEKLTSLNIKSLKSKSWVANEFLDDLCNYDLPNQGLDTLILNEF